MKYFTLLFLASLINMHIDAANADNLQFYLVRESVKKSYGFRYQDYLKILSREQRRHKFILIKPNYMEILYERGASDSLGGEPERADSRTMNQFCRLLASRSARFRVRFNNWRRLNLIHKPDLLLLAHDLNSRRQIGDE